MAPLHKPRVFAFGAPLIRQITRKVFENDKINRRAETLVFAMNIGGAPPDAILTRLGMFCCPHSQGFRHNHVRDLIDSLLADCAQAFQNIRARVGD